MKKILVTGGTVFVSRYVAEYYAKLDYEVYVLNRNTRKQSDNVTLIGGDRHNLGNTLKAYHFDIILDITAYTKEDITILLDALGGFDEYIMISSSAVYPEFASQPFMENGQLGENKFWGKYGTDKIEAEKELLNRVPNAYILRPPYLYGPMNNVYREAFVFECALTNRIFYLPKDGTMELQFFHVNDLCRFIDVILDKKPEYHIFNVGNKETISIKEWIKLCYEAAGKEVQFISIHNGCEQRNYFPFYDYEYYLDVTKQYSLMPDIQPLPDGLKKAFDWYVANRDKVTPKPYLEYIEDNLA